MPIPAYVARSRCPCAICPPTRPSTSWSTSPGVTTDRIAATWKRSAPEPTEKEPALYDRLKRELGVTNDPLTWSPTFARIAWRLHVPAAVADLKARAESEKLSMADRRLALETIAFTKDRAASSAMIALADPKSTLKEPATWWLLNRMSNDWSEFELRPALKTAGIYDPETITLREIVTPKPAPDLTELAIDDVVALTGNAARGKTTAARCVMCHSIDGTGADFGPALDGWGRGKSVEVVARAIVRPSAEVALGYDGTEIKTKDGLTIQGILLKTDDPLMMRSMGGVTQIIPADRVADAPPHVGVADDERCAAGAHRTGRRGSRRLSQGELITIAKIANIAKIGNTWDVGSIDRLMTSLFRSSILAILAMNDVSLPSA